MFYEGILYRPPSEARSLILQITVGCRHNTCTFCTMYKEKTFRIKSAAEIQEIISEAAASSPQAERIFLADGDALTIDTPQLMEILDQLYATFPNLKRVGIYGGPKDILAKSAAELALLKEHGLSMVYLGVESGNHEVLKLLGKGVTPEEMSKAGQKLKTSGITLSCTIMLGVGGKALSKAHAFDTAKVISQIDPQFLGALTMMLEPAAPLIQLIKRGDFLELDPWESLTELKIMLENLKVSNCVFRSNHASNYLPLRATFPQDRDEILKTLNRVLETSALEELRPDYWRGL